MPGAGNLIATLPDTGYADPVGAFLYYKLCAVDVHGDVGGYATTYPVVVAGVVDGERPGVLCLAAPAPKPAPGFTTLRFGLPRAAAVDLGLYDPQGCRVRGLLSRTQPAGESALTWDGRDESGRAVPAGLYFVRLATGGRTFVSRFVVAR